MSVALTESASSWPGSKFFGHPFYACFDENITKAIYAQKPELVNIQILFVHALIPPFNGRIVQRKNLERLRGSPTLIARIEATHKFRKL